MWPKAVLTERVKPRAKELRVGRGAWRRQLLRALYTRDIVPLRRGTVFGDMRGLRVRTWTAGRNAPTGYRHDEQGAGAGQAYDHYLTHATLRAAAKQ